MLEAVTKRMRVARLTLGLFLAKLGAAVAGEPEEKPEPPTGPFTPGPTIGPEAQAMINAGRRPPRRREVEVRVPLAGSAEDRRRKADAERRRMGS